MVDASEWTEYYDANEDRAPREMLLDVLDTFGPEEHLAVDLGCGSGIDTLAMLERGWSVLAIDAEEEAIRRVRKRVASSLAPRLRTLVSPMEEVELPPADLVWAGFSLFFCHPDRFGEVWQQVRRSIRLAGRFAGELLGDRDSWAPKDDTSAFTSTRLARCSRGSSSSDLRRKKRTARPARSPSIGTSSMPSHGAPSGACGLQSSFPPVARRSSSAGDAGQGRA